MKVVVSVRLLTGPLDILVQVYICSTEVLHEQLLGRVRLMMF